MDLIVQGEISSKILTLRGRQVMLDRDLAELYQVENRVLNQSVKRNIDRFPDDFMFQITKEEFENLKSQIVISSSVHGGIRNMPYAFTEEGIYTLVKYYVGVHPCVYPLNMYKDEILNIQFKGQTHVANGQTHGSAPTGGF